MFINNEDLGQRIRRYRKASGMTMKELGLKLNLSEQAISQYERGKREPNYETLTKIAEILEVSSYELMTGSSLFAGPGRLSRAVSDAIELYGENYKESLKKDSPNFKTIAEYKENSFLYWKDVVTEYTLNKIDEFNLDSLSNDEIEEIATFLDLAFETKISELKNKRTKK